MPAGTAWRPATEGPRSRQADGAEGYRDGTLDVMSATESNPPIERVAIVADEAVIRAGLSAYFLSEPGWDVVALGLPGLSPQDWIPDGLSDLVVWDGGGNDESLELVRDLLPGLPPTIVLIASTEDAEIAWTAGARAVLHRQVEAEVLLAAARAVLAGLWASDAPLDGQSPVEPAGPQTLVEPLTSRELQVLRLMADGLPNKLISAKLSVTESTVKFHVNSILRKLDARSRTEAVVRAGRIGLIPL